MAISDKDYAQQTASTIVGRFSMGNTQRDILNMQALIEEALLAAIAHGRETGPGWEKDVRDAEKYLDMINAPICTRNGYRLSLTGRIAMTIQGFAIDRVSKKE